ncbi:uncharacterized protein LOC113489793 [Athene cunicularia]|uniref:uncharacterized protein LOC113489793 n=1 Tax=Athene cunicularia TaxID=194338 RepID=UPI000EF72168|nr:uncharacterized protein LOC113489793 [Athene cunicularia]
MADAPQGLQCTSPGAMASPSPARLTHGCRREEAQRWLMTLSPSFARKATMIVAPRLLPSPTLPEWKDVHPRAEPWRAGRGGGTEKSTARSAAGLQVSRARSSPCKCLSRCICWCRAVRSCPCFLEAGPQGLDAPGAESLPREEGGLAFLRGSSSSPRLSVAAAWEGTAMTEPAIGGCPRRPLPQAPASIAHRLCAEQRGVGEGRRHPEPRAQGPPVRPVTGSNLSAIHWLLDVRKEEKRKTAQSPKG